MKLQQDKRITFPERLQSVGAPFSRLEQKCIEAFLTYCQWNAWEHSW